ncbi:MAG: sigma-70 family RNA polymerase sigma factor [Deltaproteobacteria bacterium]|nr:sigma-70 family RNA polymerase sigma factor [Deltaproteobacteria bacterium]
MNTSATQLAASDADLVGRSLSGDREAFRELVERHQSAVCAVAYAASGSRAQSEDLAQETFLQAFRDLGSLREPEKLRGWLCGIARNLAHNSLRRGRDEAKVIPLEAALEVPARGRLPEDDASDRQEEALLWRSLTRLPETYREPLVLFYREHQSVAEVSTALALPEDTVRQRLSRGRKLLEAEVQRFIEGTLTRGGPGADFAAGVMAGLPPLATGLSAAGTATAGTSLAAKSTLPGILLALSGPFISIVGTWAALQTALSRTRTPAERAALWRDVLPVLLVAVLYTAYIVQFGFTARFWDAHEAWLRLAAFAGPATFVAYLCVSTARSTQRQREVRASERAAHPEAYLPRAGEPADEYVSPVRLLGVPLVHLRRVAPAPEARPAFAWIASGDRAIGLLYAQGPLALAPIAFGTVSIGLVSLGSASLGLVSVGGAALGLFSLGGSAIGLLAIGGVALGHVAALGGAALSNGHALGAVAFAPHADDAEARTAVAALHLGGATQALLALVFVFTLPLVWVALKSRRRP